MEKMENKEIEASRSELNSFQLMVVYSTLERILLKKGIITKEEILENMNEVMHEAAERMGDKEAAAQIMKVWQDSMEKGKV